MLRDIEFLHSSTEGQCKASRLKVDRKEASSRPSCGDGSGIGTFADVDLQHFSCGCLGPTRPGKRLQFANWKITMFNG